MLIVWKTLTCAVEFSDEQRWPRFEARVIKFGLSMVYRSLGTPIHSLLGHLVRFIQCDCTPSEIQQTFKMHYLSPLIQSQHSHYSYLTTQPHFTGTHHTIPILHHTTCVSWCTHYLGPSESIHVYCEQFNWSIVAYWSIRTTSQIIVKTNPKMV